MTYRVVVDWAPACELLISLEAFVHRPDHKILELGTAWVQTTLARLSSDLRADLASAEQLDGLPWLHVLAQQCPGTRDVAAFLGWLAALSAGEMYERLAPYALESHAPLPRDAGGLRDRAVRLLARWDEQYFRHVEAGVLDGLRATATSARDLAAAMAPLEMVEQVTNGIEYLPEPLPELVVLIPQYHYRPWNVFGLYRGMHIIHYPVDVPTAAPGDLAPPEALLRLARALADESRLRILRFLAATGPRSFTEVVRFSGLSKSTVHHHLVILRAAGLVRVRTHRVRDAAATYELRPHLVATVGDHLRAFLQPDAPAGGGMSAQ